MVLKEKAKKKCTTFFQKAITPKLLLLILKKNLNDVLEKINIHLLPYPFIVKPDVGMEGILFRKIENKKHLETYHASIPTEYLMQEFVDFPLEIGLFYFRHPQK